MTVCGKLGMTLATRIGLLVLLSVVAAGGLAADAEKEKKSPGKPQGTLHTIDARVTYSAGTSAGTNILAERQPGFFNVPAGQVARHFKYSFVDPKSGIERDRLNNHTIYCETTKSWVEIPADPATLELPPGDYKFVVGGSPGASGTLNFRTFANSGVAPPPTGGDKRPPPIIRKPPPPGDTTKTGVKRDPLHPGGEGTRKVTVHLKTRLIYKESPNPPVSEGDVPALLTIKDGTFVLEFQVENVEGRVCVSKWEGTAARSGDSVSVKGKTYTSLTIQMKPSGTCLDKATGTFTGKSAGNRLSGKATEEGTTTYSNRFPVRSFRRTYEWYIEDFNK